MNLINRQADCFRNTRCRCRHYQDCTRHVENKVRKDTSEETLATCEEIQRARDDYGSNEIEIDEECAASHADDGVWVAAWVWLSEPYKPENDQIEADAMIEKLRFPQIGGHK